jgi:hypothetical protein
MMPPTKTAGGKARPQVGQLLPLLLMIILSGFADQTRATNKKQDKQQINITKNKKRTTPTR